MTKLVKRLSRGGPPPAGGAKSKSPGGGKMSARAQPEKKSKHSSWKDDYNKDPKHKWKGRAGKAVRAREEAKRPGFERGRELTVAEVAKMMAPVIQPVRAKYSGQGFAKPSCFLELRDANFSERLTQLYDEHVDGFTGKSFQKMGNAQDNMLWRQRLKAKAEADGTVKKKKMKRRRDDDDDGDGGGGGDGDDGREGAGSGTSGGGGGARWKRKDASSGGGGGDEPWMGTTTTDPASGGGGGGGGGTAGGGGGGLSRKQKKLAAQMGLSEDAFLKMQTAKVKVEVDEKVRDGAIAAYRAMQRAKLSKQNARGR